MYVIDVSQSVEHDHPHALEFLRKDCANVIDFFSRRSHRRILSLKQLYDFVILDVTGIKQAMEVSEPDHEQDVEWVNKYFDKLHAQLDSEVPTEQSTQEQQIQEAVFKQIYIPRTLDELPDVEHVFNKLKVLDSTEVAYKQNMESMLHVEPKIPLLEAETSESEEDESNQESGSESNEEDRFRDGKCLKKDEDKDLKKVFLVSIHTLGTKEKSQGRSPRKTQIQDSQICQETQTKACIGETQTVD